MSVQADDNNDDSLERILAIRHLDPGHKLVPLLESVLASRGVNRNAATPMPFYWDASFYGLQNVTWYSELSASRQESVLAELSRGFLREACFIERFGFDYTSKLMLLSETIEEKSTFALMASDEARHLNGMLPFLDFEPGNSYTREPLVMLLADILRSDDRQGLIFLLQALLEGYGLFHYSHLMHGCNNAELQAAIGRILKDEGFHHASGVSMLDEKEMTPLTREFLYDMIAQLVAIIQQNNGVLTALEQELGGLTRAQKKSVLEQIDYDHRMAARMAKTRDLICEHAPADLVATFERKQIFRPMTSDDLVAIL
jgi:hypothetical protein